jgi:hypothetical protein
MTDGVRTTKGIPNTMEPIDPVPWLLAADIQLGSAKRMKPRAVTAEDFDQLGMSMMQRSSGGTSQKTITL